MTLEQFELQEATALRAFMNANADADTCEECGARHLEPRDAWEHRCSPSLLAAGEQLSLMDVEVI